MYRAQPVIYWIPVGTNFWSHFGRNFHWFPVFPVTVFGFGYPVYPPPLQGEEFIERGWRSPLLTWSENLTWEFVCLDIKRVWVLLLTIVRVDQASGWGRHPILRACPTPRDSGDRSPGSMAQGRRAWDINIGDLRCVKLSRMRLPQRL